MVRKNTVERKSVVLSREQLQSAIKKISRRIDELERFDVDSIQERWDPSITALTSKVNSTLQDVLGVGTVEYNQYSISSLDTLPLGMGLDYPIPDVRAGYKAGIKSSVLELTALREIFEERLEDVSDNSESVHAKAVGGRKVFVVHGHDDGLKETVARYLSKLKFEPIILHEQPSQGRTIIEKFEQYADADFAVALFTPDDVGYRVGKVDEQKSRARQNVVLELGFFLGKLGRSRVCVLYSEGVEIPSDYSGVLFVPLDRNGMWKMQMAKEMKACGLSLDLNLAV